MKYMRSKGRKSWVSAIVTAVMLLGIWLPLLPAPVAKAAVGLGTTYYVDATLGDDSHSGTSEGAAWKTLEKVNVTVFQPGDNVLLKAGDSWDGQLWPKGSGSGGQPIVIDKYGAGSKPKINGKGLINDAVRLFNQSYWEVHNLDISNAKPSTATPGENLGDYRGIHVSGDLGGELHYFRIIGVDVHDVTGEINWISGTQPNPPEPGIRFKTGWDGSKKTGGIVFDTTVPDLLNPPGQATVINDVIIENSTIKNTSFAGIIFKQYTGDDKDENGNSMATATGWGTRVNASDPKFTPHTNIVIRNNFITQEGTAFGCNGMYLTNIRGGVVEKNVVYRTGTSGIEAYYADDIVIQYNEVYETQQKAGGADSNGIDPDKGTTNILIQYNYVHDNGDGILICQFVFGNTVIRYNVIKSNTRYPIYLHSDTAAVAEVYNNTIYNDKSNYLIYGYGSSLNAKYHIRNNNIFSTRSSATLTTSSTINYENNNYYGASLQIPASDTLALQVDPKFVSTTVGPSGTVESGPRLDSALGFRSQSGAMTINSGLPMANHGGKDYTGNELYNGQSDIGAFEYYTSEGSLTESVNGKVKDGAGKPVAGATITLMSSGMTYTALSDAKGYYFISNLPFGNNLTLTAEKHGYSAGSAIISIQPPSTTTQDLIITSASPFGGLTGQILDERANPLVAAAVIVKYGTETIASGISGSDGVFQIDQVPIGENYTVIISRTDYRNTERKNVSVSPASVTDLKKLLVASNTIDVLHDHTFNLLATGAMIPGDSLTVSTSGGKVEVVELPSAEDKSVKLTRTTNSGSTSLAQTFAAPLKGFVTIEADVMRNDPYVSGNNWFGVPYVYGSTSSTSPGISAALSKNKIRAYKGTSDTELMDYALGRWYNIRMVVNTVNQTFDLYIDGILKFDDANFRRDMPDITRVDFYANSSNYGSVHIDNVRITQGIGYAKNDASLVTLTSSGSVLNRLNETEFAVEVPSAVESVTLTPTASSPFARSILVNGIPTASGTSSAEIHLTGDQTIIPVVVTAEDGATKLSYKVTVNRFSPAMDSSLKQLTVSSGTLTPSFDKDVTSYSVSAAYETEYVTVTPTASYEFADITIKGRSVSSGQPAAPIAIAEGDNAIEVVVFSADGTAITTYTVIVKRALNPYGQLTGIVKDSEGRILSGAEVVLNSGDGSLRSTTSDQNGIYLFGDVIPATNYSVTASKPGYDSAAVSGIAVARAQSTTVSVLTLASPPPVLTVDQSGGTIRSASIDISGKLDSPAAVTINGIIVPVAADLSFTSALELQQGANPIVIEAIAASGKKAVPIVLNYFVDSIVPVVKLNQTSGTVREAVYVLSGAVSELSTIKLNGVELVVTGELSFETNVTLHPGDNTFVIQAVDLVGNTSEVVILHLVLDTAPPVIVLNMPGPKTGNHYNIDKSLLTVTGRINEPGAVYVNGMRAVVQADLTFTASVPLKPGMNQIQVTVYDLAGNAADPVGYNVVPSNGKPE
ncbi:hypothetical protein QFZ77_003887 [Paenibacillus sp. V4I3]|uniref:carboxypeptidase regulatory-like domain-containing protein n=1 Tax=Paenibacillus sp. V4I3 TaxID=3042305 RepID=UPI002784E43B|nr:carboxypeptidase regulatory-like domain-containing protein [Paenibacillus sp. V4I3]MDQ0875228.1 hypothetical protein [Paenibacillus sp. V4I3]